jgi:hypothetical protein
MRREERPIATRTFARPGKSGLVRPLLRREVQLSWSTPRMRQQLRTAKTRSVVSGMTKAPCLLFHARFRIWLGSALAQTPSRGTGRNRRVQISATETRKKTEEGPLRGRDPRRGTGGGDTLLEGLGMQFRPGLGHARPCEDQEGCNRMICPWHSTCSAGSTCLQPQHWTKGPNEK